VLDFDTGIVPSFISVIILSFFKTYPENTVSLFVSTEFIKSTTSLNESKSAEAARSIESILFFSTSMFDCRFNSTFSARNFSSFNFSFNWLKSEILSVFSLLILFCNSASLSFALFISLLKSLETTSIDKIRADFSSSRFTCINFSESVARFISSFRPSSIILLLASFDKT